MVTISPVNDDKTEQFNDLMNNMSKTKEAWDEADGTDDEQDRLLSEAIDAAISQGKGWGPGEKEAYLEKILDDDFIPPMFATSTEEVQKSGLQDAFTSLIYDGESATSLMLQFRKKGNDAFVNGKRNEAGNVQYYRDAINHYFEALAWANKIEPLQEGDLAQADTDDPTYNETELDHERSAICANIALCHLLLKNWGHVREEAKRALAFEESNVKAWYRLAKAYQGLQQWEQAGDAIDKGLGFDPENKELRKLQTLLTERVRRARQQRQQRERARAERVAKVKEVNLAVYFEVHPTPAADEVVHPDSVELLQDQASCMRFYEAARALKGDEGPDVANVVRAMERKHLHQQRKKWKKKHGSLWAKPDPSPLVRVHPALSLKEILADARLVVPNFLVTFLIFPEKHPAHAEYLKQHKSVDVLQPKGAAQG
eukprot:scaffold1332_cov166-Amphora_coffeaeformis.AAC.24